MSSFGFKIVDRYQEEIQPLLQAALQNNNPVEIGFYFHNLEANEAIWRTLPGNGLAINTHLDHRIYNLSTLHEHLPPLAVEIDHIKTLGSDYSIIHVAPSPFTIQAKSNPELLDTLHTSLCSLNDLCEKKQYAVFIENTFGGITFYRELFTWIAKAQLSSIHFCFDIGHAKVWSGNNLASWIAFLQDLRGEGFQLHFHLHNNRGKFDDHLSFLESAEEGLNNIDAYSGKYNYLQALQRIEALFPNSRKIFEVKPHLAIANMEFVASALNEHIVAGQYTQNL